MNHEHAHERTEPRERAIRTARAVVIALAIAEAILIFGVVVPSVLRKTATSPRPPATGESHD